MKNILLVLSCIAMLTTHSQNEINGTSNITDVTVFLRGAQVSRQARVSLKAGENILTFSNLAHSINPKSVNVKGNENFLIKSVNYEFIYENNEGTNAELEALENELDEVDFSIKTRQSLQRVYVAEKDLLIANKSIKGESEILLAEDLREMASFYREHLEELEYKLLEIQIELNDLNETKNRLQSKIYNSRGGLNNYSSKVEVTVVSSKNVNAVLDFSYIVNNASWYATYDIRTAEVNEPVQLAYKANISQTTGIDWENVKLTLSTGNPMVNGNKPILNPWYLTEYNAASTYDSYNENLKKGRNKEKSEYKLEEESEVNELGYWGIGNNSLVTEPIEALVNTEFPITINYDIPSNGESYEVEIQREDLNSGFSYYAAPGEDKNAFLLARLTDWTDLNILPGEASIYFQGSFVGNSFIDPYSTEDTLDISLGKDKNIILSREKLEDFCKTNSFGGNKKTSRAFKITIKNTKNKAVTLKLQDQIPVSNQNNITVEVEDLDGANLNENTGILTWEVELQPGETKEFTFQYTVKYPKKIKLARL